MVPDGELGDEGESQYGLQLPHQDTHLWPLYAKMLGVFFLKV